MDVTVVIFQREFFFLFRGQGSPWNSEINILHKKKLKKIKNRFKNFSDQLNQKKYDETKILSIT